MSRGREYLAYVTELLEKRISEMDEKIQSVQKDIEGMHEYYWKTIQRWTSTVMKTMTTSRHFSHR